MLGKVNNSHSLKSIASSKATDKYQKHGIRSKTSRIFRNQMMRVAVPMLSIAGVLAISFPSQVDAALSRRTNNYRACAGRLVNNNISPEAASEACAKALYPGRLSVCLTQIVRRTQLDAKDALSSCEEARRPEDLATCVVGISRSSKEAVDPQVLNFCGRSLLPVRFAQCVVGLRSEIDLAPSRAMETCINAGDPIINPAPSFIPANQQTSEPIPSLESNPITPNTPVTPNTPPDSNQS